MRRVCIIGISGKLGQYTVQHALAQGYELVGVCRSESVGKLDHFGDQITLYPGRTDDREVVQRAMACLFGPRMSVIRCWPRT